MNKIKKNPRSQYIIFRVSKKEKNLLEEESMESNLKISDYVRIKLGLDKDND